MADGNIIMYKDWEYWKENEWCKIGFFNASGKYSKPKIRLYDALRVRDDD